ncbi:hypothetical protein VTO42DRAFT_8843 [Malbranchea cinnamomea]
MSNRDGSEIIAAKLLLHIPQSWLWILMNSIQMASASKRLLLPTVLSPPLCWPSSYEALPSLVVSYGLLAHFLTTSLPSTWPCSNYSPPNAYKERQGIIFHPHLGKCRTQRINGTRTHVHSAAPER